MTGPRATTVNMIRTIASTSALFFVDIDINMSRLSSSLDGPGVYITFCMLGNFSYLLPSTDLYFLVKLLNALNFI